MRTHLVTCTCSSSPPTALTIPFGFPPHTLYTCQVLPPSLLMIVGDLSYADGYGPRWDSWGRLFSPLLSRLPLVALAGNHEVEPDMRDGIAFGHWRRRFRMPEVAPEVTAPGTIRDWRSYDFNLTYEFGSSYFSFDTGLVHVVCLNTYVHAEPGSAQLAWLEADLNATDRSVTPWVLVFAHGPWYNSNAVHATADEKATSSMKAAMEPLLHRHRVGAFFAGHVHAYERSHPVYLGRRTDTGGGGDDGDGSGPRGSRGGGGGTVHVTIGDGGNREGLYDHWQGGDGGEPLEWVAFTEGSHYGRGELTVENASHLRWRWWPNGAKTRATGRGAESGGAVSGGGDEPAAEDDVWIANPHLFSSLRPDGGGDVAPPESDGGGGDGGGMTPVLLGVVASLAVFLAGGGGLLARQAMKRRWGGGGGEGEAGSEVELPPLSVAARRVRSPEGAVSSSAQRFQSLATEEEEGAPVRSPMFAGDAEAPGF